MVNGIVDRFLFESCLCLYKQVVNSLLSNKADFIVTAVEFQKLLGVTGTDDELLKTSEELFGLYLASIKIGDSHTLYVLDTKHKGTGIGINDIAMMYEYGTGAIPPKPIWRNLNVSLDIINVTSSDIKKQIAKALS